MNPLTEMLKTLVVAGAFGLILILAEGWRRWLNPPVEWTRKFAHFTGGLLVAAFPWLFHSLWSVLALGLLFGVVMRLTRQWGLLPSIHGVHRRSEGDVYYLMAVCALFAIGREQPVFYLISILVLVVADTAAALLGSAYGRWTYSVEEGQRSLEGSGVFFLTAFLSVHLPLLLLTDLERETCILISVQIALLVTSFEAISLRGNDNLVVPLATFFLLVKMTPYSASWIGAQLAAQVGILGVLALAAWRVRLLTLSGVVAAHLFFYGAWALGGPEWVVAPALGLAACMLAWRRPVALPVGRDGKGWQVAAVFYTGLAALLLYVLDDLCQTLLPGPTWLRQGHPFFMPFVGVVAAQLAILLYLRWEHLPYRRRVVLAGLTACAVVIPAGLVCGPGGLSVFRLLGAAAITIGGLLAYTGGRRLMGLRLQPRWELRLQAASVVTAAVALLPLLLLWRALGTP